MLSLALSDVSVSYPGLAEPALFLSDLSITAGERVAVTGPSGSGKSTLVNILTGLDRATRGSIVWQGTDIARLSEGARDRWRYQNVGLIMQDFHLFAGLSAIDNVLLPARLRLDADNALKARAASLLDRVGLGGRDQPIATLSRGEMQRVAVARAVLRRPGILVADEPSASLDAASGAVVADLLDTLSREDGTTLIVVSHDDRIVNRLDRRIHLIRGRIHPDESSSS
ncbi:ABC transporter ATP-binding protein [Microvirga antarctica]|uniref:ABC transporter ATP-binding protein n=1 Tax=Microvirga antarctica TaxID=2819233 RepID=UPI001B30286C|nr:ABC transporter ATP-binding protein [Microvirga antarctica]